MTFHEPIIELLPASEEQILAAFPKSIHPDAVRRRLRRLLVDGVVKQDRWKRYRKVERPVDKPLSETPRYSKFRLPRKKFCPGCGEVKTGREFRLLAKPQNGRHLSISCVACLEKGK